MDESGSIDCGHILEQLSDYIDGEAAPEICEQIKQHLGGCKDCDNFIESVKKVVAMYRGESESMTEEARNRLHAILEEQCREMI